MNNQPHAANAAAGYLSEEGKRKFTITVGVLAAVCFVAQFVLPMALWIVMMPSTMMFQMNAMTIPDVDKAALWEGALWYTESGIETGDASSSRVLKKFDVGPDNQPEDVLTFQSRSPALLPAEDKLWIISKSSVQSYAKGKLNNETCGKQLGDISLPFLMDGRPAVLEKAPAGMTLQILQEDGWKQVMKLPRLTAEDKSVSIDKNLLIVPEANTYHLFLKYGSTLYYRCGFPAETADISDTWESITDCGHQWSAAVVAGRPTVITVHGADDNPWAAKLVAVERGDAGWSPTLSCDQVVLGDFRLYAERDSDRMILLCGGMPNSMRVMEIRGSEVLQNIRLGSGFPFPPGMIYMMMIPYAFMFLLPFVLVFIYSGMMRRYRVCSISVRNQTVPYAPLWRRAVAQTIDMGIASGFTVAGYIRMMASMMDMEKMFSSGGPFGMFASFGLIFGGLVWGLFCFLIYAFTEGRWGASPGKWITRIQVLGIEDLQPCGFGRAFLRSILKFVDGFFSFMVGVLLVALTENWQRVGDMVARTVVIDINPKQGSLTE